VLPLFCAGQMASIANMQEIWSAGNDIDAGACIGDEKCPFHDYQPPSDYDPPAVPKDHPDWMDDIESRVFVFKTVCDIQESPDVCKPFCLPHEKFLGILRVSNPASRKDLADRTWGSSGTNSKCRFCSR